MEGQTIKQEMLIEGVWVPFEPEQAATSALLTGVLITRTFLDPAQIADQFKDCLSQEEIDYLKEMEDNQ